MTVRQLASAAPERKVTRREDKVWLRALLICLFLTLPNITAAQVQVPAPGTITTIAASASGSATPSGDGGSALQAGFLAGPITSDSNGNVYLSDEGGFEQDNELRRITASTGIISKVFGDGTTSGPQSIVPRDLTLDGSGNLFVLANDASFSQCYIAKIVLSTGQKSDFQDEACPGSKVGQFANASARYASVATDTSGSVYWAKIVPLSQDPYGQGELEYTTLIYKKSGSAGTITLVAGDPSSIAVSGDGKPASQAGLGRVNSFRLDQAGNMYIISNGYNFGNIVPTVRKIDASTGIIATIAGGGSDRSLNFQGSPTDFTSSSIEAIAVDGFGHLFIADTEDPASTGQTGSPVHLIRLLDMGSSTISTISGGAGNATTSDGVPASSALLGTLSALTTDAQGNIYLSDPEHARIRIIGKPSPAAPPSSGPPQPPQLSSVFPSQGPPGSMVTITGVNFGQTQGSGTVDFEGQPAPQITNVTWSDTKITFFVPQVQVNYAIDGLINVATSIGASNPASFTILPSVPQVSSILPDPGAVGSQVTIYGSNFGATVGQSTVTFGGVTATPASWSPTSMLLEIPSGAKTGSVIVNVGGSASSGFLYLISAVCSPPS